MRANSAYSRSLNVRFDPSALIIYSMYYVNMLRAMGNSAMVVRCRRRTTGGQASRLPPYQRTYTTGALTSLAGASGMRGVTVVSFSTAGTPQGRERGVVD